MAPDFRCESQRRERARGTCSWRGWLQSAHLIAMESEASCCWIRYGYCSDMHIGRPICILDNPISNMHTGSGKVTEHAHRTAFSHIHTGLYRLCSRDQCAVSSSSRPALLQARERPARRETKALRRTTVAPFRASPRGAWAVGLPPTHVQHAHLVLHKCCMSLCRTTALHASLCVRDKSCVCRPSILRRGDHGRARPALGWCLTF